MADHPLIEAVKDYYGNLNELADANEACRLNKENLTDHQVELFSNLHPEVTSRFWGTCMTIPENLEGKRVLDIGCGSGSLVFVLSKLVGPTGYVVGIDVTEGLIQTARSQVEYHCRLWGHDTPNVQFHVLNAERLQEHFSEGEFDIIVSNGVLACIPAREDVFREAYKLLKPGGQFFLSDVYSDSHLPQDLADNMQLWCQGAAGAMPWFTLANMVSSVGFTTPYLTCAAPVGIKEEHIKKLLANFRYTCAAWRLFKLDPKAVKQGPALVTYNGGISDYPDAFPWDVDTTFKRGVGVEVDGELATLLSNIYLSGCFSFQPVSTQPHTPRNQSPFKLMDRLREEGKLGDNIYLVD